MKPLDELNKEDFIRRIEQLYPPDSEYPEVAEIGEQLLNKAMRTTDFTWMDLPLEVLRELYCLCLDKEREIFAPKKRTTNIIHGAPAGSPR